MIDFQVGLFDELEAIYPDSCGSLGENLYRISAASGTYAGTHLLVSGIKSGDIVSVEIKGPHEQYRLFELIPVPVEENTGLETRTEHVDGKHNPYVIRRAPFMIYEVLQPIRNITVSKGQSLAIAFKEKIQVSKREDHKWEIYITVNGFTKKLVFIVDARATVVRPSGKDTHKYVNWINLETIAVLHKVEMWSIEWERLVKSYLKLASHSRQNIMWLQPTLYFELDEEKKVRLNTKHLDKLIQMADEVGIYYLQGCTVSSRKDEEWYASEATLMLTGETIPGEGEATLYDMMHQLYKYIQAHGLVERWIQSFFDEPEDASSEMYKNGVAIVKRAMPGIQIVEANKASATIEGAPDIWCPTVNCYEKDIDFYNRRIEAGDHVWVYTCLEPTGPYLNRLLDMERVRQVLIGWVASLYPVEGFLHWGGNYYFVDPYRQSCIWTGGEDCTNFDIKYGAQLPAGDCGVYYPGCGMALSSTRLEAHRIGFEDLELIEELKTKDYDKAVAIVRTIARGYKDYDKDYRNYRIAKEKLLNALEEK